VEYVADMPLLSDTVNLENQAWGRLGDGTVLGPTGEVVRVVASEPMTVVLPMITRNWAPPAFTAIKTAEPEVAYAETPGELITYTVVFVNEGTVAGTLVSIRDLLPTGFTFVQMLPGSDVLDPPSGSTGLIYWAGPYVVEGGSSLSLIFQVQASSTPGTYVNYATATAVDGRSPAAPAEATVQLIEPILLSENWDSPSTYWEPFLNYWRLNWLQWHVDWGIGVGGSAALNHTYWYGVADPDDGAHDALYFYNAPGADTWRNYRMEARVKLNVGITQGFWFRAKYIPSELGGRHVEGYYLVWRPGNNLVKLSYINNEGQWAYHFADPIELTRTTYHLQKGIWYNIAVEVRDNNIKAYVDDNLVIDFDDDTYSSGTVGFFAYQVEQAAWDNVVVTQLP
jgi:uncharacterized repeat protein (TIGR01451 family)